MAMEKVVIVVLVTEVRSIFWKRVVEVVKTEVKVEVKVKAEDSIYSSACYLETSILGRFWLNQSMNLVLLVKSHRFFFRRYEVQIMLRL